MTKPNGNEETDQTPDPGPQGMTYDSSQRGKVVVVDENTKDPAGGILYGIWRDNKFPGKDTADVQTIDEGRIEVSARRVR